MAPLLRGSPADEPLHGLSSFRLSALERTVFFGTAKNLSQGKEAASRVLKNRWRQAGMSTLCAPFEGKMASSADLCAWFPHGLPTWFAMVGSPDRMPFARLFLPATKAGEL